MRRLRVYVFTISLIVGLAAALIGLGDAHAGVIYFFPVSWARASAAPAASVATFWLHM
jgi:hypothetical protein